MPVSAAASAREILTRLHDVMAKRLPAQSKLNAVVEIIGTVLDSEVCSIYLLREGVLELFATRGLAQEAVHFTTLALGEGLVGTIAANVETLNLDEATAHPRFRLSPRDGRGAVPQLRRRADHPPRARGGGARGPACRSASLRRRRDRGAADRGDGAFGADRQCRAGRCRGRRRDAAAADHGGHRQGLQAGRGHGIEHTVAEDTEAERRRVYAAFDKMREQIDRMASQAEFGTGGEHDEVLATYKMFAYDEGWSRRINEAIDSGLTAEAAIERVQQRTRMRMREISDPLLADRMHDLEDLSNRLIRIVSGHLGTAAQLGLRQDSILIARNLGPAELLEYDRRRLKGVVLEEGSLTAHVTIVARAMGVPVLGRVRDVKKLIAEGDMLLLDVGEEALFVRPTSVMEEAFEAKLDLSQKRRAAFARLRGEPPVTKDGHRVTLMVNAGLRDDVAALDLTGADGIGLFRTEFQFLVSATLPQRRDQEKLYRSVLDAAGERPVTFRTVDIGGDKSLPYLNHDEAGEEENPAMGCARCGSRSIAAG